MNRLLRTFYVVRHAKAGNRDKWEGDDRLRPLSKKGLQQAEELVRTFKPFPITAIFSSPYLRCMQTVEPLAHSRGLEISRSPSLEEGHGLEGLGEFFGDESLDKVVLSTHGDILWELVEDLRGRHVADGGDEKGATWVCEVDDHGVVERATYLAAP